MPRLITAILCVLFVPGTALAQTVGAHAGVSVHPEQFYFGAQAETGPLADRVRFRPSIDLGLGDNRTTASFNVEFVYHFRSADPWNVYAGGGPALNIIRVEGDTSPEPGLAAVAGLLHEDGLFVEAKFRSAASTVRG